MVDYEREIRVIADKSMEDYETILSEFDKKVEGYTISGTPEAKAKLIALKQIKGSYQALLRSKSIPFEGFIFAVGKKRNKNVLTYPAAIEKIESYKKKYGADYLVKAVEDQVTNEKGEPVYGSHNTTPAQAWMKGQVILANDWEKVAYGFFRPIKRDESGAQIQIPLKYCEIRISNPDKVTVIPGISYKFRATCSDLEAEKLNLRANESSKFERTGPISFDVARKFIEETFGLTPFIDVYVMNDQGGITMPDGVRFYVTETTIVSTKISDRFDVDNVEFQSLHDNDVDDNIAMVVPKTSNTTFDNAVGLAIYRPYYSKAKPEKNIESAPTGELIGFLHDTSFGDAPPSEINELGEDDFE